MGNPNVLWYKWGNERIASGSAVQQAVTNCPLLVNGGRISQGALGPFLDGSQVTTGGKGGDFIQLREMTIREVGSGFPNTNNPAFNVLFEIDGIAWYNFVFRSRITGETTVDFGVTPSNLIAPPSGDAPLIINGGQRLRIFIQDGPRLNNSDRLNITIDLWGIKI